MKISTIHYLNKKEAFILYYNTKKSNYNADIINTKYDL